MKQARLEHGRTFELIGTDAHCRARRSQLHTSRGSVQLPNFMPVGTQGTVKGITAQMVRATGAQMVLANTYHLSLRPGEQVVQRLGGLHAFMGWEGPILTDSGGFQLVSLAHMTQVNEQAATFRSHIDGRLIELSPERAMQIQQCLGSDIAMVLDHVVPLPADPGRVQEACERTVRWAERCRKVATSPSQTQFAIVQGGLEPRLRVWCAEQLVQMQFSGYAIGGLSVGESMPQMYQILDQTCPVLPADRPRYLMGVGRPPDILQAVRRGVDLFDCVMPTRNGRNALAFTDNGPLRMRNKCHQDDLRPIDPQCGCPACRHSRGYIRHLFAAGEMLGPILLSAHNLTYYQRLMSETRRAIELDRFEDLFHQKMNGWRESTP